MTERTDDGIHRSPNSSWAASGYFGLTWILVSAVGWGTGGSIGAAVGSSTGAIETGFAVVVTGAGIAAALQWLVLRRQLAPTRWWVPATIGALALVGVLVFVFNVFDAGVGVAIAGTVLGVAQWLVLRGYVSRAGWWVLASTVGWVGGGFLSGAFEAGIAGWTTIGLVYGAITGATLVRLLRRRPAT